MAEIRGQRELNAKIRSLADNIENDVKNVIAENAYLLENKSKDITPVDTGRLRNSIGTELNGLKAIVMSTPIMQNLLNSVRGIKDHNHFFLIHLHGLNLS